MATIVIIDATTNTVIEREETSAEAATRSQHHAEFQIEVEAETLLAKARVTASTKLKALGLTPAEIAALIGA